jgi:hypothetical protein
MRISDLFSRYAERDIHWLKIDVEGMERAVIESWAPAKARPWIVLIECTTPTTADPSFVNWEPLFLTLGYEFVYFDGLNRFYVSRERPELKNHFGAGPNIFDDFVLSGRANAPFCANLNAELALLRQKLTGRDEQIKLLIARSEELRRNALALSRELDATCASTSWRITKPLRQVAMAVRSFERSLRAIWRRLLFSLRIRVQHLNAPSRMLWAIDADPNALSEWKKIVSAASRKSGGDRRQ